MPKNRHNKDSKKSSQTHLKTQKYQAHKSGNHAVKSSEEQSNKFEISSSLNLDNPWTILFLGFMLSAAAIGGYQYTKSTTKSVSIDDITLGDPCKTTIFYESHNDAAPASHILGLLPRLIGNNYTTFLIEEPQGMTLQENIEILKNGLKNIDRTPWSPSLKQEFKKSFVATADLLTLIKEKGLTYVAVDMDKDSRAKLNPNDANNIYIRDKVIAKATHEACQEYKTNQVLLVGAVHGGIATILRELGHEVVSAYIASTQVVVDPSLASIGRANNDELLRSKNTEYMEEYGYKNTYIIDLYGNPLGAEGNLVDFTEELFGPSLLGESEGIFDQAEI